MGSHKKKGYSYIETFVAPTPPIDYIVSGDPDPDCTGNYTKAGVHDGRPYYRRITGTFYLYWVADWEDWVISTEVGKVLHGYWSGVNGEIEGYYYSATYTGNPFVTEGPH